MTEISRELNEEIVAAIEKNLPAQIGSVLTERLAKVAGLEQRLRAVEESNTVLNGRLREQSVIDREKEEIARIQGEQQERERELDAKRESQRYVDLQVRAAHEKVSFALQVVELVFANNRFKYNETLTQTQQVPYQGGNYPQFATGPVETSSKTVEGAQ